MTSRTRESRIGDARRRAGLAKLVLAGIAATAFVATAALARVAYPGHHKKAVKVLSPPQRFVETVRRKPARVRDPGACPGRPLGGDGADMNRFSAMGCDVLVEGATAQELAAVRALFDERDAVFSRFRPASELNAVDAGRGGPPGDAAVRADGRGGAAGARADGGLVDPTLGAALEAAGYDRDFSRLEPTETPPAPAAGPSGNVELYGRVLVLGRGVRLDLNGVVKAAAVDDALRLLSGPGFVSAGGDLATRGDVAVALPGGGAVRLVKGVSPRAAERSGAGGVAARSSTT